MKTNVAIIGAGPAGLTAAYLLSKNNVPVTVLEADPVYVGGISRTATYKGFHFDIGGHRFFSKSKAVELSMAHPGAEKSDGSQPDGDDARRHSSPGHDVMRAAANRSPQVRLDHAGRFLFLRGGHLLHLSQRGGLGGDGEHAPLRILRARVNRAGNSPFFASITDPATVGARQWHGGHGVAQRGWTQRAGVVRLEFYEGQLGSLRIHEN